MCRLFITSKSGTSQENHYICMYACTSHSIFSPSLYVLSFYILFTAACLVFTFCLPLHKLNMLTMKYLNTVWKTVAWISQDAVFVRLVNKVYFVCLSFCWDHINGFSLSLNHLVSYLNMYRSTDFVDPFSFL